MLATGVQTQFVNLIVERLEGLFEIDITEGRDGEVHVMVASTYGSETVEQAVDRYMLSAEADAFQGKRTTAPGTFAMAVRRMRLQ